MRYATEADGVLLPKLTRYDRDILAALPPERPVAEWGGPWEPPYGPRRQLALTVWEIAEAHLLRDVACVQRTIDGLTDLGYVRQHGCHMERRGRPRRYYRTDRGSAALSTKENQ